MESWCLWLRRINSKILALDVETTTSNKGNPFDTRNKLVCVSWWWNGKAGASRISDELSVQLQRLIDEADIIVGFNFKFDMHWLRKWGLKLDHKRIWDCQIAEFVLERQRNSYPSLEDSCIKYDLGHKIDIIKLEYWNKGINTDEIPWPILRAYATMDAELTYKLFIAQQPCVKDSQRPLLTLLNADLHVLTEMEHNGILFDEELCNQRSAELDTRVSQLSENLNAFYPDVPINWNSPDQLSAFLYGGTISQIVKDHDGFYKTGAKAGLPKFKNREVLHQLPQLYKPLKGSEMAKEGVYSTSEDTLLKLSGKKGPINWLLELSKLEKLNGTYYKGLPKLNLEMSWPVRMLHGVFNTCVAQTGRLSSSKPNLQNFASDLQDIFVTRFL